MVASGVMRVNVKGFVARIIFLLKKERELLLLTTRGASH
jgi:hypothetical protein